MTWDYLPVLNKLLQILVTIAIGTTAGAFGVLSADDFVPAAVRFVFYVALPCLITKGIGIGIDFYSETNIWGFIAAFLILRAIALLLALSVVLFANFREGRRAKGIGYVAVLWLSLTWISTVILGIPICTAVFGNPTLGVKYGILAGVSSFIFQLPVQLFFLECHAADERSSLAIHVDPEEVSQSPVKESVANMSIQVTPQSTLHAEEGHVVEDGHDWWRLLRSEHIQEKSLWMKIGRGVLHNPVLWGIFIGFVISLSTAGQYLRCPSETCVPGLAWIGATLGWLGDCVIPLSLFAMGMWMHGQGIQGLLAIGCIKLSLCMLSKLVLVPLLMVALANGMNLTDEAGRAAILIATLPISMASFSLAHRYNIGEKELATNVAVGTLLMLPTVLLWNVALDAVGLYPIASA